MDAGCRSGEQVHISAISCRQTVQQASHIRNCTLVYKLYKLYTCKLVSACGTQSCAAMTHTICLKANSGYGPDAVAQRPTGLITPLQGVHIS